MERVIRVEFVVGITRRYRKWFWMDCCICRVVNGFVCVVVDE